MTIYLCICMYIYIHIYIYIYIYIYNLYIYMCVYIIYIYIRIHAYIYICIYTHIHRTLFPTISIIKIASLFSMCIYKYTFIYTYICTYMYIYIHIYACTYIYLYIYIYRTLFPTISMIEIASLFSMCYEEGNTKVTADVFMHVADLTGLFSRALKLSTLPLLGNISTDYKIWVCI
jgi:hypothetical protein